MNYLQNISMETCTPYGEFLVYNYAILEFVKWKSYSKCLEPKWLSVKDLFILLINIHKYIKAYRININFVAQIVNDE